ncbi:MAG: PAS domain-containing sensor histidine kinase [Flavobacteriaceae bacterium]|nr:PAS domain-containing sensor histidine kinase [Flavobacteriaceae bacterium]
MFQKDQDIFNILFEAVSEGIIVTNDDQKIVAANTSVEDMFGYNKKEIINKQLNILIPQEYHSDHGAHFKGFLKQGKSRHLSKEGNLYGAHKDGSIFPVEIGLNPFEVYGKTYVLALIIDVTIRKQQELKINELNEHLEEKVAERTKELGDTVNKLKALNLKLDLENKKRIEAENVVKNALKNEKELNELKTKFLSLVSHELKTPLSGILTSAILLGKYELSEQQEKRNRHIKIIINKVQYLNNILNDFLSVEKLETGKVNYNFKAFKLSKVVNEVIYDLNMLLKEGQKINYPENIDEISLFQDEKIVELILSNLIHNAIKYSPENSMIDVVINQNDEFVICNIKDYGIGIPLNDQGKIFNRYFRAENALTNQGTGIGLNIVKGHLENLGGSIHFESKEHKGTTFTIKIPNKVRL